MAKLISVSDEVYRMLKRRKNGKSFNAVIAELCSSPKKTPFDAIKGWQPDEKFLKSVEDAYKRRGKFKLKRVKF